MNVLVPRQLHDRLIGTAALARLFANYSRTWGLAGVTFHGVRHEDREALNQAARSMS